MRLHREGYRIITGFLLVLALINALLFMLLPQGNPVSIIIAAMSLVLFLLVILFFRLPQREMVQDSTSLFAPADGKVVVIEEVFEKEYFKDQRLQVSVFMSPMNVHSNRYPLSGEVKYVKYHPGKYLVAWHPKSSELNERSTVVVRNQDGVEILIRQIAGALARRIVTYSREGDNAEQGDELGFIKFGSRVDMLLPLGTEIIAPMGSQVRYNRSVIARIKKD